MPSASNYSSISHRFFFAILPPEFKRASIAALRDTLDPPGNPVRTDRLDVTMGMTGGCPEYPKQVAEQLLAIGGGVQAPPPRKLFDQLSAGVGTMSLRPARGYALIDSVVGKTQHNVLGRWPLAGPQTGPFE